MRLYEEVAELDAAAADVRSLELKLRFDDLLGVTAGAAPGNPAIVAFASKLVTTDRTDIAYGAEMSDDMKKMQDQLNNQVLSKPFSVADEAQVKSYIEDAQRRGEVPQAYKGKHWRPGYTCVDLRPYSYREYLGCQYYYSYYGH